MIKMKRTVKARLNNIIVKYVLNINNYINNKIHSTNIVEFMP